MAARGDGLVLIPQIVGVPLAGLGFPLPLLLGRGLRLGGGFFGCGGGLGGRFFVLIHEVPKADVGVLVLGQVRLGHFLQVGQLVLVVQLFLEVVVELVVEVFF